MFIYRDEIYDPEPENDRARPRSSWPSTATAPPASVRLAYIPMFTRFENMARGFE